MSAIAKARRASARGAAGALEGGGEFFLVVHRLEEFGEAQRALADAAVAAHLQPQAEELFGDAVLGAAVGGGFFEEAFPLQHVELGGDDVGGQAGVGAQFGGGVAEAQAAAVAGPAHREGVHDHLGLLGEVFEAGLVIGRGEVHQALEVFHGPAVGALLQQGEDEADRAGLPPVRS
jgi:hypothetical protein